MTLLATSAWPRYDYEFERVDYRDDSDQVDETFNMSGHEVTLEPAEATEPLSQARAISVARTTLAP